MLYFCRGDKPRELDSADEDSVVTGKQSHQSEPKGRILLFPARSSLRKGRSHFFQARKVPGDDAAAIGDLSHFEQGNETDDYPRRMAVNALAFGFIVMLTLAGLWIAEAMAVLQKNEDCALSGRRNCADLGLAARER